MIDDIFKAMEFLFHIMVRRHVAVEYTRRDHWDGELWWRRSIHNLSAHRWGPIDNRPRSQWSALRGWWGAIDDSTLWDWGTVREYRINDRAGRRDKRTGGR